MRKLTWLHVVLFIATIFSTILAGMLQKGIDPLQQPRRILEGLPFALTLMTILLSHELAHYLTAARHRTVATLPYFIPAPSLFGTFGAFIKMKSPITTRTALIDIGASGPICGFVVSVVAVVIGLFYSASIPVAGGKGIILGDSMLFAVLTKLIVGTQHEGYDVLLNPVAVAGWIGFFVTSMNLLPIGQLDGGHIVYALLNKKHPWFSRGLVFSLGLMGVMYWDGWIVWAVLLLVMGVNHPPVLFDNIPLHPSRKKIALASLIIFIATFMPQPFKIN
ncbi:MAG: site-2 protease family protein [Nitrospirae bacterium]|nr:site-2 protease family protein [Nitrospirota bacterium]